MSSKKKTNIGKFTKETIEKNFSSATNIEKENMLKSMPEELLKINGKIFKNLGNNSDLWISYLSRITLKEFKQIKSKTLEKNVYPLIKHSRFNEIALLFIPQSFSWGDYEGVPKKHLNMAISSYIKHILEDIRNDKRISFNRDVMRILRNKMFYVVLKYLERIDTSVPENSYGSLQDVVMKMIYLDLDTLNHVQVLELERVLKIKLYDLKHNDFFGLMMCCRYLVKISPKTVLTFLNEEVFGYWKQKKSNSLFEKYPDTLGSWIEKFSSEQRDTLAITKAFNFCDDENLQIEVAAKSMQSGINFFHFNRLEVIFEISNNMSMIDSEVFLQTITDYDFEMLLENISEYPVDMNNDNQKSLISLAAPLYNILLNKLDSKKSHMQNDAFKFFNKIHKILSFEEKVDILAKVFEKPLHGDNSTEKNYAWCKDVSVDKLSDLFKSIDGYFKTEIAFSILHKLNSEKESYSKHLDTYEEVMQEIVSTYVDTDKPTSPIGIGILTSIPIEHLEKYLHSLMFEADNAVAVKFIRYAFDKKGSKFGPAMNASLEIMKSESGKHTISEIFND